MCDNKISDAADPLPFSSNPPSVPFKQTTMKETPIPLLSLTSRHLYFPYRNMQKIKKVQNQKWANVFCLH